MSHYFVALTDNCLSAILNGIIAGRHKGLDGAPLKRFVSREFYPFGERENYPYKVWLRHIKNYRFEAVSVVEVVSLRSIPLDARGSLWCGKIVGGESIGIRYAAGELIVKLSRNQHVFHGPYPALTLRIAEPECHACELVEAIQVLEATGLFDFSRVDETG